MYLEHFQEKGPRVARKKLTVSWISSHSACRISSFPLLLGRIYGTVTEQRISKRVLGTSRLPVSRLVTHHEIFWEIPVLFRIRHFLIEISSPRKERLLVTLMYSPWYKYQELINYGLVLRRKAWNMHSSLQFFNLWMTRTRFLHFGRIVSPSTFLGASNLRVCKGNIRNLWITSSSMWRTIRVDAIAAMRCQHGYSSLRPHYFHFDNQLPVSLQQKVNQTRFGKLVMKY